MLNEGFYDKLKANFQKATEVSKVIKDKGEEILGKIISKAKDAVSFVKGLLKGIKEFFTKMYDEHFPEIIKKNFAKIKDKIDNFSDKEKNGLKNDLKVGKDVVKWYKETFMNKVSKQGSESMTKFFSSDQEGVSDKDIQMANESLNLIMEGGNVIATMVHGLEKIPPFSWLHKVATAGEKGANVLIEFLSNITKKMGGPEFELPVIAALLGIVLEQAIKGESAHWLLAIAGSGTPLYWAIKGIKYTALVIALIIALDNIIGGKIGVSGSHDEHGDHDEQNEKDENIEPQE
jgi:hypothetical protein